jgi:hypothetical protein
LAKKSRFVCSARDNTGMAKDYWLDRGPHAKPDDGRCAMEWVSYLAGEPHTDRPSCVSPALRSFCVAFNDGLDRATRQTLRPYLTRTIGTAGDGFDEARGWMALDWLIRLYAPAWLDLASLHSRARGLTSLAAIDHPAALDPALEQLTDAQAVLRPARTGLRNRRAARSARRMARSSGEPAAWLVLRVSAGGDPGAAACAAARSIAADAALTHVRGMSHDRRIREMLDNLYASSFDLLDRMLPTQTIAVDPGASVEATARAGQTTAPAY